MCRRIHTPLWLRRRSQIFGSKPGICLVLLDDEPPCSRGFGGTVSTFLLAGRVWRGVSGLSGCDVASRSDGMKIVETKNGAAVNVLLGDVGCATKGGYNQC